MDYKNMCLAAEEYQVLQEKRTAGTIAENEIARMEVLEPVFFDWLQLEQDKALMRANEMPEGWW